jgi:spore coat protein U-like protein
MTIELDGGTNAFSGQRRLASGGNYINYHLYQPTAAGNAPSSPAVAWGNGGVSATGSAFTSTCNGNAQLFNVYAQVPAGQTLFAGTYTDAVMVTVTY